MAGVTFDTGTGDAEQGTGAGDNASAVVPAGPAPEWDVVEAEIARRNATDHQIATVWHPAPRGEVVNTALGNVRVLVGDVAEYQLSTGEKIAL